MPSPRATPADPAPAFTVVIPCYNGARYLEAALRSALDQSYPPLEILVIDDGSTDGSRAIARSFWPRVECLEQAHQGPSAARNLGTARARGDFIAFLDADDLWMADKLTRQAKMLQASPDLDLVYTGYTLLYPDGSTKEVRARPPAWTVAQLRFECPIMPSTVVARTELLRAEKWSNAFGSSEDWDLLYRLTKRAAFGAIVESTIFYRQHPESLCTRDWKSVLLNARKVSSTIQRDLGGVDAIVRARTVDARLYASAAIAARQAGESEYFEYIVRSLAAWPLPSRGRNRGRLFARMLLQRLVEVLRGKTTDS